MYEGSIVFDCNFSMEITDVRLKRGCVVFAAQGKVLKTVPQGVIPYTIYGADGILIAVSTADFDALLGGRKVLSGDTIVLDLDVKFEYMRGATS